jgi:hypothetical protein
MMSRHRGSRLLPLLAVGAAGIVLAACGGGSSSLPSPVFPVGPPGGLACPLLAINGPALLSPAPGSTGVPTTLTALTFDHIANIPQTVSGTATLTGSDGTTITSGPLTPSANGATTTASIAGLQPHTTYAVAVSGTLTGRGCSTAFAANDGSFTTQ